VTRISKLRMTLVVFLLSMLQSHVTANVVPSSPILVTLMTEVFCSSKTSVLTRAIWSNIPHDDILQSLV
jgi:hypothetical protein